MADNTMAKIKWKGTKTNVGDEFKCTGNVSSFCTTSSNGVAASYQPMSGWNDRFMLLFDMVLNSPIS